MNTAEKLGKASIALAEAALDFRGRGDYANAKLYAERALDAFVLAKVLGWKPDTSAFDGDYGEATK